MKINYSRMGIILGKELKVVVFPEELGSNLICSSYFMLHSSSRSALWLKTLANILVQTKMSVWKPQAVVKLRTGASYLGKMCKCKHQMILPVLSVLLPIHVG